ncbi:MAG: class I SAM-dependent methyltransferase [Promethearchaeota archaeon]
MMRRLAAWKEVSNLTFARNISQEVDLFYRNIVVDVLQKEGLLSFLEEERDFNEIAEKFEVVDKPYLNEVLIALLSDKVISYDGKTYRTNTPVIVNIVQPHRFNDTLTAYSKSFAEAIPARLKGKYFSSTTGYNLFMMDDALSLRLYETVRRVAIAFANVLEKEGRFIDIGCGNGIGTADIWNMYLENNFFKNGRTVEIYGIDIDKGLLSIAEEEFLLNVSNMSPLSKEQLKKYDKFFPKFDVGTATDIPFEDNYFDMVYISQVLHWTDPKKALKEMYRITKPGGMVFGTNILKPRANEFLHVQMKTVEGAHGFFTKDDFKRWIKEARFKKMDFVTPLTCFKLIK